MPSKRAVKSVENDSKQATRTSRQHARDRLEQLLSGGSYRAMDRIPSIDALVGDLGLGRMGIQQAVSDLVEAGVLTTVRGKGTFFTGKLPGGAVADEGLEHSTPSLTALSAPHRKRIRVGLCGELPTHAARWQQIMLAYMRQHPDIQIEIEPVASSSDAWGSSPPDILQVPSFQLRNVVESGHLFDPSEIDGFQVDSGAYYGGAIEGGMFSGVLWALPTLIAPECVIAQADASDRLAPVWDAPGLWQAMAEAQRVAATMRDDEAVLLSRPLLPLLIASGVVGNSFHSLDPYRDTKCRAFFDRLAPYVQNPQVFQRTRRRTSATDALHEAFLAQKGKLLIGSVAWLDGLAQRAISPLRLRPLWSEPQGGNPATVLYTAIHHLTPFPYECRDLIAYLGSCEVQTALAEKGQLVAHCEASERCRIPGVTDDSLQSLLVSMAHCVVTHLDRWAPAFYSELLDHEVERWRRGEYSTDEFVAVVANKGQYFYRSRELRAARAASRESTPAVTLT